jgi:hypothetical protein
VPDGSVSRVTGFATASRSMAPRADNVRRFSHINSRRLHTAIRYRSSDMERMAG